METVVNGDDKDNDNDNDNDNDDDGTESNGLMTVLNVSCLFLKSFLTLSNYDRDDGRPTNPPPVEASP